MGRSLLLRDNGVLICCRGLYSDICQMTNEERMKKLLFMAGMVHGALNMMIHDVLVVDKEATGDSLQKLYDEVNKIIDEVVYKDMKCNQQSS